MVSVVSFALEVEGVGFMFVLVFPVSMVSSTYIVVDFLYFGTSCEHSCNSLNLF